MSTQSSISITDGKTTKTIYCNWDGYLSNNGNILLDHYTTEKKVKELIALGAISCLKEHTKPTKNPMVQKKDKDGRNMYDRDNGKFEPILTKATKPHTYDNPNIDVVIAYNRDGGEHRYSEDNIAVITKGNKPANRLKESYDYLFKNNQWYVRTNKNFVKLTKNMCKID